MVDKDFILLNVVPFIFGFVVVLPIYTYLMITEDELKKELSGLSTKEIFEKAGEKHGSR